MVGGRARDRLDNYQLTNNIEEDEALTKARLRRINRDVVLLHKVGVVCWGSKNKNARALRAFLFGIGKKLPNNCPKQYGNRCLRLRQMTRNEFRHFEHGDLFLATENGFQLVVRIDIAFVCFILQLMLLDVFPDFFSDFSTWHWSCTDDSR